MKEKWIASFTIYSQLTEKYGEPDDMTPQYPAWHSDAMISSPLNILLP